MVIFHSYVSLPEGKSPEAHELLMKWKEIHGKSHFAGEVSSSKTSAMRSYDAVVRMLCYLSWMVGDLNEVMEHNLHGGALQLCLLVYNPN